MPTLRIVVFRDVLLVDRFQDFKPVNQQNNNAVETSNSAVTTFLSKAIRRQRRVCIYIRTTK
jgi:hypothetical protein